MLHSAKASQSGKYSRSQLTTCYQIEHGLINFLGDVATQPVLVFSHWAAPLNIILTLLYVATVLSWFVPVGAAT